MTADIAVYRSNLVPVGEDQASHLEICREIVRRFNGLYGDVFPEPKALFTPTPKVNGIDGRKMSKSYNNTIGITESAESVRDKVMAMVTDPARARRQDPGQPRQLQSLPVPRDLLATAGGRGRRPGVPDGGARLRGLQEAPDRQPERRARALPREARGSSWPPPPTSSATCSTPATRRARRVAEETMEKVRAAVKLSPEP